MAATTATLDDAALIAAIQFGTGPDPQGAFGELVRRHQPRMSAYLACRGLAREELEDVANETWKRAWQGVGRYQYRAVVGFFPWVRGIADRVMLELTRDPYLAHAQAGTQIDVDAVEELEYLDVETLRRLTREEINAAISDLLSRVPNEDFRVAIEAAYLADMTTDEIVELTGWTRSKVYTVKHRALQWLKERLLERYGSADIDAWLADS